MVKIDPCQGATKIYVDLEMEYVATLIERFSSISNGVQIIQAQPVNDIPLEEQMFVNRMSIKQLLETDWDVNIQVGVVLDSFHLFVEKNTDFYELKIIALFRSM
ncbi:uncharacterized protein [Elaeis guineensis]|uniref:uncharacterized protein isoform X2 n=1 Tax=Elaeis guineensis var. tenera TaxID=51953 RepID=UPI003C6D35C6